MFILDFIQKLLPFPFIREHVYKRAIRSSLWPRVRKLHLSRQSTCVICGRNKKLQVHHIVPFHIDPSLELESSNLITFCSQHHLTFGHLGWWRCTNYDVVQDALYWKNKYNNRRSTLAESK